MGASDIAATRMVPAMRAVGHEVVAVASGSVEWARTYAQRHGIGFATDRLTAMLDRTDIDAVYISSLNDRHRAQTEAAAAAGKHVLCEKPLALSLDDGDTMVRACESAGVVFATNHPLPGAGPHRAIRDLVHGGAIGDLLGVRVSHAKLLPERLRGWRLDEVPGAGVILDITVHDASVLNPLLGVPAVDAVATAVRQGTWEAVVGVPSSVEDAVMATVRYKGDVLVSVHDAFTVGFGHTGLEVYGTRGTIVAPEAMTGDPNGAVLLRNRSGEREIDVADRRDPVQILLAAFADAVAGTGTPTVTGRDGVRALAVALAVREAATTGHRVLVG